MARGTISYEPLVREPLTAAPGGTTLPPLCDALAFPAPAPRRPGRLRRLLLNALIGAALLAAAAVLVPAALGFERYVITGGSMTGSIDRGSVLISKQVPVSDLRVGDVITYTPPPGAGPRGQVTHRIVSIGTDRHGAKTFRTKGDANAGVDPWTFTLDQPTQAREAFHIPYLGYAFAALSVREVRMAVIGLPALLIALMTLGGLWRDAGRAREAAR